ncbi:MAG: PQQ-dependent sugar dehydrogenase, partial [Candidatus Hydrogenedentes bacterium]|nr:PQQ-dependent sugar dehydrogenase [Candidatus Hydrogenedentota bacterium]
MRYVVVVMTLVLGCGQAPAAALALLPVAEGLDRAVYVTAPRGDTHRLFVVEQTGQIHIVRDSVLLTTPFLDISDRVTYNGLEAGLLGLAFHPDFATNGLFYLNYTAGGSNLLTRVSQFSVIGADPFAADSANPNSETVRLSIDQPFANHDGGMIAFGLDDYLYIGMGDGGSANDPLNRGQDIFEPLGKLLRYAV